MKNSQLMISVVTHNRLRRVWAILLGMSALAITVGMVTVMIHDRMQ